MEWHFKSSRIKRGNLEFHTQWKIYFKKQGDAKFELRWSQGDWIYPLAWNNEKQHKTYERIVFKIVDTGQLMTAITERWKWIEKNPMIAIVFCLAIASKLQCRQGEPMWNSADSLSEGDKAYSVARD